MTCYAESRDGHEWSQPKLGIVEINGNRENNVILRASPFSTNLSPFLDDRPGVPADQRFKATAGLSDYAVKHAQNTKPGEAAGVKGGLYTFASPDCIHWRQLSQEPAITMTEFGFDSQNVSFWSEVENQFVCYFRSWQNGLRSISRSTSPDFVTWSKSVALNVVPTSPTEMSIYHDGSGDRFVLRTDGFASVHVGADVREMVPRPLRFTGKELVINYSTSAGGSVRVEIQDESCQPIPRSAGTMGAMFRRSPASRFV